MSLQGIFDPMARAYFAGNSGGTGGGGGVCEKKSITVTGGAGDVPAPFSELIGLEVVDILAGRMFLSEPTEKPITTGILLKNGTYFEINYDDYNGVLSKPCLLVSGSSIGMLCPSFFENTTKYQALIYAFEEVTDTMGMGLTFAKGWHAVNVNTFANEPFDPETYTFMYTSGMIEEYTTSETELYVKEMFSMKDVIFFTVKPENIFEADSTLAYVTYQHTSSLNAAHLYTSFVYYSDSNEIRRINDGTALITYTSSSGGSGGSSGTHNIIRINDTDADNLLTIPADILGVAISKVSDDVLRANDLVGGYIATPDYCLEMTAENTADDEGMTGVYFDVDSPVLVSIHQDIDLGEFVVPKGTYIQTAMVTQIKYVLLIYPA